MASDIQTQEGSLQTPDGHTLYTKTWLASTQPARARVAFLHGFSDHCNFYETLFEPLARAGITVHSFDQRGWGRSVGASRWARGRTGRTAQVLADITTFLRPLLSPSPSTSTSAPPAPPLFLMGHSMGGAETLVYAAEGPADVRAQIRGFLAEAPFVALHPASRPWTAKVVLGRLAARVAPNMPKVQRLDAGRTSRDAAVVRRFREDVLCHDTGTLAGLAGMLQRAEDLEGGRVVLKDDDGAESGGGSGSGDGGEGGRTRLWIGHGTADEICGFEGTRAFFDRTALADKELRVYEGWYHKLHMEPGEDKVVFANDVAKWILDRSGPLDALETAGRAKL